MAYVPTVWANDKAPAINADNLNHMEQGIKDAHDALPVPQVAPDLPVGGLTVDAEIRAQYALLIQALKTSGVLT